MFSGQSDLFFGSVYIQLRVSEAEMINQMRSVQFTVYKASYTKKNVEITLLLMEQN